MVHVISANTWFSSSKDSIHPSCPDTSSCSEWLLSKPPVLLLSRNRNQQNKVKLSNTLIDVLYYLIDLLKNLAKLAASFRLAVDWSRESRSVSQTFLTVNTASGH